MGSASDNGGDKREQVKSATTCSAKREASRGQPHMKMLAASRNDWRLISWLLRALGALSRKGAQQTLSSGNETLRGGNDDQALSGMKVISAARRAIGRVEITSVIAENSPALRLSRLRRQRRPRELVSFQPLRCGAYRQRREGMPWARAWRCSSNRERPR